MIDELSADAEVTVPWWGPAPVTLLRILVHVTAETQRHAGHADVVRELIDSSAGLLQGFDNLRVPDPRERRALFDRIESAAHLAGGT